MVQRVPMTVNGEKSLREELDRLKNKDRPTVIAEIAEARAHGDLKENAEYHAARDKQSFLEGRIAEVEGKLANAQVIDVKKIENRGRVIFGSTIILINPKTEETVTYQIVGEDEADLKIGKISVGSPIARALVGKEDGDAVVIQTQNGVLNYDISEVKYI